MKEPKPKLAPQFTPEWDFMNDPKLYELQLCLDSCYVGTDPETQGNRDLARAKFATLWSEILTKYLSIKENRALLIKFLRVNFKILDLGGIAKGNDSQITALREANKELIQKYGIEYWAVVRELEK